jgi:hypothetical protein
MLVIMLLLGKGQCLLGQSQYVDTTKSQLETTKKFLTTATVGKGFALNFNGLPTFDLCTQYNLNGYYSMGIGTSFFQLKYYQEKKSNDIFSFNSLFFKHRWNITGTHFQKQLMPFFDHQLGVSYSVNNASSQRYYFHSVLGGGFYYTLKNKKEFIFGINYLRQYYIVNVITEDTQTPGIVYIHPMGELLQMMFFKFGYSF